MSNIDKQALREAAEKATKGQWAVEFDDEIYSTDGVNNEQIAMVFSENEARDAAFIAAANPATVLALLDELEAKDKSWAAQDDHINQQADRIESLEKKNGELGRALGAAEERIACQCGIIQSARKFINEYAGLGDVGAAEFIKIIDRAAAGKGEAS